MKVFGCRCAPERVALRVAEHDHDLCLGQGPTAVADDATDLEPQHGAEGPVELDGVAWTDAEQHSLELFLH